MCAPMRSRLRRVRWVETKPTVPGRLPLGALSTDAYRGPWVAIIGSRGEASWFDPLNLLPIETGERLEWTVSGICEGSLVFTFEFESVQ